MTFKGHCTSISMNFSQNPGKSIDLSHLQLFNYYVQKYKNELLCAKIWPEMPCKILNID